MSTISASTTSTTAYKVTADTTGTLVFQTGASPTTAMTIGSDQKVGFGTASPTGVVSSAVADGSTKAFYAERTGGSPSTLSLDFANAYANWYASGTLTFSTASAEAMRINANGCVTKPKQPRFWAYEMASGTSGQTEVFKYTYVNVGSSYNTSTGIFTVPTGGDGTYVFTWGILFGAAINDTGRFYLYKNGSNAGTGQNNQLRIDLTATGTEILYGEHSFMLNAVAGDQFKIYFIADSGSTNTASLDYSFFSGYLMA